MMINSELARRAEEMAAAVQKEDKRVAVPKKVADGIEFYKREFSEILLFDLEQMRQRASRQGNHHARDIMDYINRGLLNKKNYLRAILDGYKVEEKPEVKAVQKMREQHVKYVNAKIGSHDESHASGFKAGMLFMKDTFGLNVNLDV